MLTSFVSVHHNFTLLYFRKLLIVKSMTTVKRQRKLKWNKASYRDLVTFKLPRKLRGGKVKAKASWSRKTSRSPESARNLFPVKVLQKKGDKIKVHYIGYDKKYDEWKNQCDIETITDNVTSKVTSDVANQPPQNVREANDESIVYKPYSLYNDLSVRIKRSIVCSRTASLK